MQPEKSHSLPSSGQRTKKTCGVIQSKYEGLRTQRPQRPKNQDSDVQGQELLNDVPAQEETACEPFLHLFFVPVGLQEIGIWLSTLLRADLLTPSTQANADLFWKRPHGHIQK